MTTLADLTLPMTYEDSRQLALVYSYEIAVTLYGIQESFGDPRHVPVGRQLTDGTWMLCGDVLSEVGDDGLLVGAFSHITPELMAQVEVVPLEWAVGMLPQESA
jgi:hypothetical protein